MKAEKARILLVEDDDNLAFVVKDNLELTGYTVCRALHGEHGWELFQNHRFDLCLLDVMLPKRDGFSLAQEIRGINQDVPIIFLTARNQKEDRIHGFQKGGDDYLIKPFSMEELILRMEVFLRRSGGPKDRNVTSFHIGNYVLDMKSMLLTNGSLKKRLTRREAELLKTLAENSGMVVKREELLKAHWGDDDYFMGRSLDVFISRLRKYLADDSKIKIENIHALGFKLSVEN